MTQQWADYSDEVTADQLDGALRQAGVQGVFHYLSGNDARRLELVQVVQEIRRRGWPQMGISVPLLGSVNGAVDAYACRNVYGFGDGFRLFLDIEPAAYDADPAGWQAAADPWCDAVRAAGMSPGIYGVDRTVAACSNHADRIWRARPGMCDPEGPGLAAGFFPGRRAVQCRNGIWNGVEMDISEVEEAMATIDDVFSKVSGIDIEVGAGYVDNGIGALLLREAAASLALNQQMAADLAAIRAGLSGGTGTADPAGLATLQASLDALKADLDAKLSALGSHLGQGTP